MDLLIAAMLDAASEGKLTQLQAQLKPEGTTELKQVRIIVIPEKLDFTWPSAAPAGSPRG